MPHNESSAVYIVDIRRFYLSCIGLHSLSAVSAPSASVQTGLSHDSLQLPGLQG